MWQFKFILLLFMVDTVSSYSAVRVTIKNMKQSTWDSKELHEFFTWIEADLITKGDVMGKDVIWEMKSHQRKRMNLINETINAYGHFYEIEIVEITDDRTLDERVFDTYPILHENIHEYIEELKDKYPKIASVLEIGSSFQNRSMKVLRLKSDNLSLKWSFWVDCGIHAREWIAVSSCMYFIRNLISDYKNTMVSSRNDSYIHKINWYILPMTNPDGYVNSYTNDNNWRTNMNNVDINRNFPFKWTEAAPIAKNKSSNEYRGTHGGSEPETKNIMKFFKDTPEYFKAQVNLHAYGRMILFPYGYTAEKIADYDTMLKAANLMRDAVYEKTNNTFKTGTFEELLYIGAGTMMDYIKHEHKVKYSYTMELDPTNEQVKQGLYANVTPFSNRKSSVEPVALMATTGLLKLADLVDKEPIPFWHNLCFIIRTKWATEPLAIIISLSSFFSFILSCSVAMVLYTKYLLRPTIKKTNVEGGSYSGSVSYDNAVEK